MSRLQCIVTSYNRRKYLKPCLESMALDPIDLYVVDGGSEPDVMMYLEMAKLKGTIKDYCVLPNNPGADVLKNTGIERYVTNREFVMSSDDFLFHRGWSVRLTEQYRALNRGGLRYHMVACPTELVIKRHIIDFPGGKYKEVNGVLFFETSCAMVAGTMMDTATTRRVGLFPVFGQGGHGDVAIGSRMRKLGCKVGYLADPIIWHLGHEPDKEQHFPEYAKAYQDDNDMWFQKAKEDDWKP